ncbi:hypothetical protein [Roseiconus lacunae]|uniref:hypothetical protein n=1 Tax=Roseiconus lacunae TaxID=2605694 RepID=UPI0011F19776|nr:hypothetical protein [Roseiconus lacunae]
MTTEAFNLGAQLPITLELTHAPETLHQSVRGVIEGDEKLIRSVTEKIRFGKPPLPRSCVEGVDMPLVLIA